MTRTELHQLDALVAEWREDARDFEALIRCHPSVYASSDTLLVSVQRECAAMLEDLLARLKT